MTRKSIPQNKRCRQCDQVKPVSEFYRHERKGRPYYWPYCKICKKERYRIQRVQEGKYVRPQYPRPHVTRGNKWCRLCNTIKSLTEFGIKEHSPDRYHSYCIACEKVRLQKYSKDATPENVQAARNAMLIRYYNITLEEYEEILEKQGGVCAVCSKQEWSKDGRTGKVRALAVDHCHAWFCVRGLLCTRCNTVLGMFNDDPEPILALAVYVQKFRDEMDILR